MIIRARSIATITLSIILASCGESLEKNDSSENVDDQRDGYSEETAIKDIKALYSNDGAFAAIKNDGTVISWGHAMHGGDSSMVQDALQNVKSIAGSSQAFAALLEDGGLVTWGHPLAGARNPRSDAIVRDLKEIIASKTGFAAITQSGDVRAWGSGPAADTSSVESVLQNVVSVVATEQAYAALRSDNTVVAWGAPEFGGDTSAVADQLSNVKSISASSGAFAALKLDGSVVVWGGEQMGTDLSNLPREIENVDYIVGSGGHTDTNGGAFTALLTDGSVIPWGAMTVGGDTCYSSGGRRVCGFPEDVYENVSGATQLFSSQIGFASQNDAGVINFWGDSNGTVDYKGDKIRQFESFRLNPLRMTYLMLMESGKVYMWPQSCHEDLSPPEDVCTTNAIQIETTQNAAAVLHEDGTVTTWGNGLYGADTRDLSAVLNNAKQLQGDQYFALVTENGKVVEWGEQFRAINGNTFYREFSNSSPVESIAWGGGLYLAENHRLAESSAGFAHIGVDSSPELENIRFAYQGAFGNGAVIHLDGSVTSWGTLFGGDSSAVADQLYDIKELIPSERGFAGIRTNGSVVSWAEGNGVGIDAIENIKNALTNVHSIRATYHNFAAVTEDGNIVGWKAQNLYDNEYPAPPLSGVQALEANQSAFAALLENGTVEVWGLDNFGGAKSLANLSEVSSITATRYNPGVVRTNAGGAFAALKTDGTVEAWGHPDFGGDASAIQDKLIDIKQIFSTEGAFAALKHDGTVITWGGENYGGDSTLVQSELYSIEKIYSSIDAFIAKREDGKLFSWGNTRSLNAL